MDSGTPLASLPKQVFILQSQVLPSTCAPPLFLHPVQPPPTRSHRTEDKTVSSAVSGSSQKFFPPPVSSKVLKRIARICSLHQSPATRIVLRLYHSHSSPSGDLKLLSSQRFSLNSHSPNSSTGIHFFVFFSIWQIDISSHLFIFFTYLSNVIGLKKVVTNCPKPKTQPWLILWCIWVFFKCRGFSSLVVIFILPPFAFNHARVAYCCMKRSF